MGSSTSTTSEGRYARGRSTLLPGQAAHRRRRGLTQRQLGELAGVAHTTVQRLEALNRGAYPQTLRKLAIALGVEPADLVGGGPMHRMTVFVRHENVARLLESLGYCLE